MPEARHDPYLNFNFLVQIDGDAIAGFAEVDLPEGRIEIATYREGNERNSNASRRLPGEVRFGPLVLRRGFSGDSALFQWWNELVQGNLSRKNVAIVLLDEQQRDVARWLVRRAWPSKLVGPNLRGLGNDVAIETLELSHEGIELV